MHENGEIRADFAETVWPFWVKMYNLGSILKRFCLTGITPRQNPALDIETHPHPPTVLVRDQFVDVGLGDFIPLLSDHFLEVGH